MTLALLDTPSQSMMAERQVVQGEALLGRGQHNAALAIADAVLANDPDLASAWLLRGAACRGLRRFAEAAQAYRFLVGLFPGFAQMRVNLANACIELEDFAQAEEQLQEAVTRNPDLAAAHASLGSLYIRMDRYELAEAPTRRALACDSTLAIAHRNLAAILSLRGAPEAETHRDAAYRQQQLFCEYSPGAQRTALILVASGSGNVPYAHLLPGTQYNRILWHLTYAPPGQDRKLPPHDFVFNAVGDPDAAAAAQRAAAHYIDRCLLPVINRPDRVARTTRSDLPALLGSAPDMVVPKTVRIRRDDGDPAQSILDSGLTFPLILRPAGRHGGEGVQLVRTPADLAGRIPGCEAFYATEFVNYRSPDGWFRKYRVIFVNRQPYPYHLAIGARWLLHYRTADMLTGAQARRAEEQAFLHDPVTVLGAPAMAALRRIGARLDLDYAGIDFSLLPDGRLLFFEANPTMLVHPEDNPLFAYKNAAVDAIVAAMETMIAGRLAANANNLPSGEVAR